MAQARFMCYLVDQTSRLVSTGRAVGIPVISRSPRITAGLGAVSVAGGIPPFPETQAYVQKVRALQAI